MTDRRLATMNYLSDHAQYKHKYSSKYLDANDSLNRPASHLMRRSITKSSADRYGDIIREKSASHTRVVMSKDLMADSSKNRLQRHISMADQIPISKARIKRSLETFQKDIVKPDATAHFNTLWKERGKHNPDHELTKRIIENRQYNKFDPHKFLEEKAESLKKEDPKEDEVTKVGIKPPIPVSQTHLSQDQDNKTMKIEGQKNVYRVPVSQPISAKPSTPYLDNLNEKKYQLENSSQKNSARNPVLLRSSLTQLVDDIGVRSSTNRQSVSDIMDIMRQANYDPSLVREVVERLVQVKSAYENSKNANLKNYIKRQIDEAKPPLQELKPKDDPIPNKPNFQKVAITKEIKPDLAEFSPPTKIVGDLTQKYTNATVRSAARQTSQLAEQHRDPYSKIIDHVVSKKLTRSFENIEESEQKTFKPETLIEDIGTPKRKL